ncbi:hypothetical protein [Clostridium sp. 'White wine YQ']|uniref:hypothetical protein n=1 Tax=Clostridium sp. 'White wine YQ' TaxID=3027474 RepID=UPI00236514DD|nr:hypothetical protein [Clostridium sp. 'White wine YQ']MDD7793575.1 hypothetical protein [Clostridium sp. 'White wine YQ']
MAGTLFNELSIHENQNKKELDKDLKILEENVRVLDATGDMLSGIVDIKQNNYSFKNKS